jgi:hypothetical protein
MPCFTRATAFLLILTPAALGQTVTWSEQIAPIIYGNCTSCHRTGQVTPFTLMSYEDVISTERMPPCPDSFPWH